ncbi:hypothetical protein I6N95_25665 [Vagococcus sp. BWB3-3]|uniref:NlpC/P60 domain-containing protein n=1 Tax=Vagococcus allomyrinae TaxID=2794353 RepID=A0A940PE71_9ENTE|nr:peptidoglycan amidohydrolase family protein [Vagococcus allomyrinae]MBP1044401.1 hypothetical protein [Vagococcus allomyrinae]
MSDITRTVDWMKTRKGKITYSMSQRLGPNSYDCSSAVFNALIAGGFLPQGSFIGNTETLYSLEGKLLIPIGPSQAAYGDVFVSGVKGGSLGSGGHTGIFIDNKAIIHCTYGYGSNNMAITPAYQWMGDYSGLPVHYYRLKNSGGIIIPEGENKPQMTILVVDGYWGLATSKRAQEYFGCAIRDGIISHQFKSAHNQFIHSAQFDQSLIGSDLIKAMQKWLGIKVDGLAGPQFVIAFQAKMGTIQDGIISSPSDCIKEFQRRLTAGKL